MLRFLPVFFYLSLSFFCLASQEVAAKDQQQIKLLIDPLIEEAMRADTIPGVAVALFYEGKAYLFNYGVANLQTKKPILSSTIFEIASITKVFTSTALAVEVKQDKVALNDPLIKFLPGLQNTSNPIKQVTLSELATHTSSLPRVPPPLPQGSNYTFPLLIKFLQEWKPTDPIGSHYLYSNVAFGLLGQALANKEGTTYPQLIEHLITSPLKMQSTFIQVPAIFESNYAQGYNKKGRPVRPYADNVWPGGGALRSTSQDMLIFLEANLGVSGPPPLLEAMQLAQKGIFKVRDDLTIGLGWQLVHQKGVFLIDKNGGLEGFASYIGMLPNQKIGIVLLANKGKANVTKVGRKLLKQLASSNRSK